MWNSVFFFNKIIVFNSINRKNKQPTNQLSNNQLVRCYSHHWVTNICLLNVLHLSGTEFVHT